MLCGLLGKPQYQHRNGPAGPFLLCERFFCILIAACAYVQRLLNIFHIESIAVQALIATKFERRKG